MPPFFPKQPLPTIAASQRAPSAELETNYIIETEHLIFLYVQQFPTGSIKIKILYQQSRAIDDTLRLSTRGSARHTFKIRTLPPGRNQIKDDLFPFSTNNYIDLQNVPKNTLVCIGWIDASINNPYVWQSSANFLYSIHNDIMRSRRTGMSKQNIVWSKCFNLLQ